MNKEPETTTTHNFNQPQNPASNEYKEIDWHRFTDQTGILTVLYSKVSAIAAAIFYVIFGGLSLMLLLTNGVNKPAFFIVVANALVLAFVIYLRAKAKRRSVKSFDAAGVHTCNGQKFLWADFRGRVLRTGRRYGRTYIWRTELIFTGNRQVWILPGRINNFEEISLFLNSLPLATEKRYLRQGD